MLGFELMHVSERDLWLLDAMINSHQLNIEWTDANMKLETSLGMNWRYIYTVNSLNCFKNFEIYSLF